MPKVTSIVRLTAPALAAFAWRNRDELLEWAQFGLRAVQSALPGGADFDDVKAEARLRYALAKQSIDATLTDPRAREGFIEAAALTAAAAIRYGLREHALKKSAQPIDVVSVERTKWAEPEQKTPKKRAAR